jgi:hypothetical protein
MRHPSRSPRLAAFGNYLRLEGKVFKRAELPRPARWRTARSGSTMPVLVAPAVTTIRNGLRLLCRSEAIAARSAIALRNAHLITSFSCSHGKTG